MDNAVAIPSDGSAPVSKPSDKPSIVSENAPSVELGFTVNGATIEEVSVRKSPLGVEFSRRVTGAVTINKVKPNSHADWLGMKSGWIIKSVDGEDVSKKTLEQIQGLITNRMSALPMQA